MSRFVLLLIPFVLLLNLGCASRAKNDTNDWWKTVDPALAKSWEILPQEARPGEVILSKRTELGVFSNFAGTPILFEGKTYASIEGFWQSLKYPENDNDPRQKLGQWPYSREQVETLIGFEAKHAGNFASIIMNKNNINWVTYKGQKYIYREMGNSPFYELIEKITREKIRQHPSLKRLLLATGDLKLRPDHKQRAGDPKAWRYYDIYMKIREELKKQNF